MRFESPPEGHISGRRARRELSKRAAIAVAASLCLLGALSFCCNDPNDCYQNMRLVLPPSLSAVPETLSMAPFHLVLQPFLNRDFMPMSPPDGNPMTAVIRVSELDSLALPGDLVLIHLWVRKGRDYWSTALSRDEDTTLQPFKTSGVARCGPKWEPGLPVEAVARLRFQGRSDWYVKAATWIRSSG
jgi:hypothetical protein